MIKSEIIVVLAKTVDIFFRSLSFLLIVRILMSWLTRSPQGSIFNFIVSTTQPILDIFRKLPLRFGMMDLTPLVALLTIGFVREFLLKLISSF